MSAAVLSMALALQLSALAGESSTPALRARAAALAPVLLDEAGRVDPPIDPLVLGAIAFRESAYDPRTRGEAGEVGVLQVKPDGMARYLCRGIRIRTLRGNVRCAVRIIANARRICGGDPAQWLSSYNGTRHCATTGYTRRVLALLHRRR